MPSRVKASDFAGFDDNNRIAELGFEGEGCTISQAGGSMISEIAVGLTPEEVAELGLDTMIEEMGSDIVKSRVRCATLALGTLQAAVKHWQQDQERQKLGLPALPKPGSFELNED